MNDSVFGYPGCLKFNRKEDKSVNKNLTVSISADTSDIDEAIVKITLLKSLIEEVKEIVSDIELGISINPNK